jgi:hypothetical protein
MRELEGTWNFADFLTAHHTLDALEEAEAKARERAAK